MANNNQIDVYSENVAHEETKTENKTKLYQNPDNQVKVKTKTDNKETKNNTVIIFDFDDTLYPTSSKFWLDANVKVIEDVNKLFTLIFKTLSNMIKVFGSNSIYIITNASILWIKECLIKLSSILSDTNNIINLIKLYKIPIVSAKDLYSVKYPSDYVKWKEYTFFQIINAKFKQYTEHNNNNNKRFIVVSIGDAKTEYIASKNAVNLVNPNILLHRLKLLERPSITQLIQQHKLLYQIYKLFKTETDEITIDYKNEMKIFLETSK